MQMPLGTFILAFQHSHFSALILVFASDCDSLLSGNDTSYLPWVSFLPSVRNFDGTQCEYSDPGSFDSLGCRGFSCPQSPVIPAGPARWPGPLNQYDYLREK